MKYRTAYGTIHYWLPTNQLHTYLQETLHRDPAELLCRQVDNRERLGAREEELEAHAPGADLDEMATGKT